jgi:purine nucleosidase
MMAAPSAARIAWLDCDGGVDDAVALLLLLRTPSIHLAAISTVFGNVPLDQATDNIEICLRVLGNSNHSNSQLSIPIYPGAEEPLVINKTIETWPGHGISGLGDAQFTDYRYTLHQESEEARAEMKEYTRTMQSANIHAFASVHSAATHEKKLKLFAPLALLNYIYNNQPRSLDLLCLGPLTNIALAIKLCPELPKLINSLWIMGGALSAKGNANLTAEFNFNADPEASHIVFYAFSRLPQPISPHFNQFIQLLTWEITEETALSWEEFDDLVNNDGKSPELSKNSIEAQFFKKIHFAYEKLAGRNVDHCGESNNGNQPRAASDQIKALNSIIQNSVQPESFSLPFTPCDAYLMGCYIDNAMIEQRKNYYCLIVTEGNNTRGMLAVDWYSNSKERKNAAVITKLNKQRFKAMLHNAIHGETQSASSSSSSSGQQEERKKQWE